MATLRETIFDRTTTYAGTEALIDDRCYPDKLPEGATFPLIVFHIISHANATYRTHDQTGRAPRGVSLVQFDCYAVTGDGADALAAQVVAAWDGYSSGDCEIGYAFLQNQLSDPSEDQDKYREIVEVSIEHGGSTIAA